MANEHTSGSPKTGGETDDSDDWDPIRTTERWGLHLKTHLVVLAIVIVSEYIGTFEYPIGEAAIIILPMLYAVVFGMFISFRFLGAYIRQIQIVAPPEVSRISTPMILISLMPLGVIYGTLVGPAFWEIIQAGPAFLLQEVGNLATILISLPVALLLGLKREAIGATVSVAREPVYGIVTEYYGADSPEGIGVLGNYLIGTFIGTIFFGILGGISPLLGFHPLSLSMGCGMGSASMMTACAGSLAAVAPAGYEDQILSFAATSNTLTNFTGLWIVLFIGLPFVNMLYRKLNPILGRGK